MPLCIARNLCRPFGVQSNHRDADHDAEHHEEGGCDGDEGAVEGAATGLRAGSLRDALPQRLHLVAGGAFVLAGIARVSVRRGVSRLSPGWISSKYLRNGWITSSFTADPLINSLQI